MSMYDYEYKVTISTNDGALMTKTVKLFPGNTTWMDMMCDFASMLRMFDFYIPEEQLVRDYITELHEHSCEDREISTTE